MFRRQQPEKIGLLKRVPLFGDLNNRQLSALARTSDDVECESGKVLARQGEMGKEFILIVKGKARVEKDGKIIAHLSDGDFFGEMSLIDGKPRSASVVTESPAELLVVHRKNFGPMLDTLPGLQKKLLITLSTRLREREDHPIG